MPGPLSGVHVLELPAIGPAPFCGALLADMGADVVRIDRAAPVDLGTPVPPRFDFYNRNKRSVALDLKSRLAVDAGKITNVGEVEVISDRHQNHQCLDESKLSRQALPVAA